MTCYQYSLKKGFYYLFRINDLFWNSTHGNQRRKRKNSAQGQETLGEQNTYVDRAGVLTCTTPLMLLGFPIAICSSQSSLKISEGSVLRVNALGQETQCDQGAVMA